MQECDVPASRDSQLRAGRTYKTGATKKEDFHTSTDSGSVLSGNPIWERNDSDEFYKIIIKRKKRKLYLVSSNTNRIFKNMNLRLESGAL
jgi:hypothetical protein